MRTEKVEQQLPLLGYSRKHVQSMFLEDIDILADLGTPPGTLSGGIVSCIMLENRG